MLPPTLQFPSVLRGFFCSEILFFCFVFYYYYYWFLMLGDDRFGLRSPCLYPIHCKLLLVSLKWRQWVKRKNSTAPIFPLSQEDAYLLFNYAAFILYIICFLLFGVVFLKVPGACPSVAHHWAARSDCRKCRIGRQWVMVAFGGGGSCRQNASCLQM